MSIENLIIVSREGKSASVTRNHPKFNGTINLINTQLTGSIPSITSSPDGLTLITLPKGSATYQGGQPPRWRRDSRWQKQIALPSGLFDISISYRSLRVHLTGNNLSPSPNKAEYPGQLNPGHRTKSVIYNTLI